jgi:hypothetical protein
MGHENIFFITHGFKGIIYIATYVSCILVLSSASSSASDTLGIFPPGSKPYGLSYEDHIKNFWKFIISLPKEKNPWHDDTGAKCTSAHSGKNSSIFYLGGNGGGRSKPWEREITVPSGKGLLIPVMVVEVSDKEVPDKSLEELRQIAKKDQDSVTNLYLKINDKEYKPEEISKYRTSTASFEVEFPENAIFSAAKGPSKAVADGHYIITEPLPRGNHTVHYKSSLTCEGTDCLDHKFSQDIKYIITAE